ncbi:MAG: hypothetical protein Q4G28_07175 [Neisseria sp.]|nr:hypothetical protein [Neisseria sp.]
MSGQNKKTAAFRLTPKHLLLAAFAVVIIAIAALLVGVFQTLNRPQETAAPRPAGENTVEIWSPRGANSPATTGTVINAPNIPGSQLPPTAETQPDSSEGTTAAQQRRTAPAAQAAPAETPVRPLPAPAPAPIEQAAAERPAAPTQQAAPAPRPAPQPAQQPAAPRQQPKDVMDNLF